MCIFPKYYYAQWHKIRKIKKEKIFFCIQQTDNDYDSVYAHSCVKVLDIRRKMNIKDKKLSINLFERKLSCEMGFFPQPICYVWRICNFYVHFALLSFTRNDSLLLFLIPLLHISHFNFFILFTFRYFTENKIFHFTCNKIFPFLFHIPFHPFFSYLLTIQMFYSKAFRERSQKLSH